jgi:hypothetical protein
MCRLSTVLSKDRRNPSVISGKQEAVSLNIARFFFPAISTDEQRPEQYQPLPRRRNQLDHMKGRHRAGVLLFTFSTAGKTRIVPVLAGTRILVPTFS